MDILVNTQAPSSAPVVDGGTAVPSNISTYRTAVRTKANEHHAAIDGASDIDALLALTYDWPTAP